MEILQVFMQIIKKKMKYLVLLLLTSCAPIHSFMMDNAYIFESDYTLECITEENIMRCKEID